MRGLSVLIPFALFTITSACAPRAPYNPGNVGQWQGPPQQGGPYASQPLPPPIVRPVDVGAIMALGNMPCAPKEVAPGTWARFDCGPFVAVSRVMQSLPVPVQLPRMNFLPGLPGVVPPAVDHRTDGTEGPIKDQGAVGVCTAMSLSSAMDNQIRRMGRQDVVSALHLWSKYGIPTMGDAGDKNVDQVLSLEPSWQYDPAKACKLSRDPMEPCAAAYHVVPGSASMDPVIIAEKSRADSAGRYKLTGIEQLQSKPANIDELSAVLAGGDDVWASFWVNDEAWKSRSLRDAVIPDYVTDSNVGHAVVLAGYRTMPDGTKQFLVHNSWSDRWGDRGYGWISQAMVTKYLRAAYKVKVGDANAPSTPNQPSSSGCPAGQVKDAVSGQCAAPCSSGSAPAAGVCLPSVPGFPMPGGGQQPAPPGGQQPQNNACPQGQAADLMTGKCAPLCAGGGPAMGGMCLPIPR